MNGIRMARSFLVAAFVFASAGGSQAGASEFEWRFSRPLELRKSIASATFVLHGVAETPKGPVKSEEETVPFTVTAVIKGPPELRPGGKLLITGVWATLIDGRTKLMIVGSRDARGAISVPFGCGFEKPSAELLAFARGLAGLPPGNTTKHTAFFLRHLGSRDMNILGETLWELFEVDHGRLRQAARGLSPDTVLGWLKDVEKSTPVRARACLGFFLGLHDYLNVCGALLGITGNPKYAPHLERVLRRVQEEEGRHDNVLLGYILLCPKEGWAALRATLQDPKAPFMASYYALAAARTIYEFRDDVIVRADVVRAILPALEESGLAEFVIDSLRKWKRWELCDRVLRRFNDGKDKEPWIRQVILRFALECPEPLVAEFVRRQRQRDPEWVSDVEELRKLEEEAQQSRQK